MAITSGDNPPTWHEVEDALRSLPGPPAFAPYARLEHDGIAVTLFPASEAGGRQMQAVLRHIISEHVKVSAYISAWRDGPDAVTVILATRGSADMDLVLAAAEPAAGRAGQPAGRAPGRGEPQAGAETGSRDLIIAMDDSREKPFMVAAQTGDGTTWVLGADTQEAAESLAGGLTGTRVSITGNGPGPEVLRSKVLTAREALAARSLLRPPGQAPPAVGGHADRPELS